MNYFQFYHTYDKIEITIHCSLTNQQHHIMNQEQIWQERKKKLVEESGQRLMKNQEFIDLVKNIYVITDAQCAETIRQSFLPVKSNSQWSMGNDLLDFNKLLPGSKELAYEIEECAAESVRESTYVYSYKNMFICYKIAYWGMNRPDDCEVCDNTISIHTDAAEILDKVKTIKFVVDFFNNLDDLYSVRLNRFSSYMSGRFLNGY